MTFGENGEGQLGHGNEYETNEFIEVTLLANLSVVNIAAGGAHSAAVTRKFFFNFLVQTSLLI